MRRVLLPLAALLLLPAVAAAGVETADAVLRQGTATSITVTRADGTPAPGASVTAVYRPGSNIPHEVDLGTTGGDGRLPWTPEDAGLVTLNASIPAVDGTAAESASTDLAVRHAGAPVGGIVILVLAGLILYGGVLYGFRKLG